jgi:hypothetical protein
MYCLCLPKRKPNIDYDAELTDAEKRHALYMCGLSDSKHPFNQYFFENMNKKQVDFLMSKVDKQDCQYSIKYATYVQKLEELSKKLNSL